MAIHRLIYVSRPFGFDSAMLGGIMVGARRNNARDGITGALICRADLYLQLLEGPAPAVTAVYARISRDDRHLDLEQLYSAEVGERLFPAWDMLDDPARSWLWSPADVAAGAVTAASTQAITGVFERVAAEQKPVANRSRAGDAPRPACPAAANA